MAEIKPFPKGGRDAGRRRWRTNSGAPGGPLKRRPPREPPPREPDNSGFGILAVLAFIVVAVAAQMTANALRPKPEEMASYDFRSCDEARAAGAAPLYHHEPWYRSYLDRDGDGVACEFHLPTAARDLFRRLANPSP